MSAGSKPIAFLEIVVRKIERGELLEALSLLKKLKTLSDAKSGDPIGVLVVEAQIYFLQGKFEEALEISAVLWQDIMSGKHQIHMEGIAKQLMDLEAKLGHKKFTKIYQRIAPGVAPPSAVIKKQE